MYRALNRLTDAASEPISTADAKDHLRVTTSDDDTYIDGLISAARNYVETITRRSMLEQTWIASFDYTESSCLYLPRPPLIAVSFVKYRDTVDGTLQTADSSTYEVDSMVEPAVVEFEDLPEYDATKQNPLQVTFTSGYSAVPRELVHAMKLLISHWYRTRSSVTNAKEIEPAVVPIAFWALVAPFKFNYFSQSDLYQTTKNKWPLKHLL